MTVEHSIPQQTAVRADERRLATAARSVLACPAEVHLVVDGVDDVLADGADLGMQDLDGVPTFSCAAGSALALAARGRRSALVTLESGLGLPGSPDRDARLTLTGRLEWRGRAECPCCTEPREVVELVVNVVLLGREGAPRGTQVRVPVEHFAAPGQSLNRGFLQRSVEHANGAHQQELRQAVATRTGTRLTDVVGASLADLDATGLDITWVDPEGAHLTHLDFPRPARDPHDLADLLRATLHAGLC